MTTETPELQRALTPFENWERDGKSAVKATEQVRAGGPPAILAAAHRVGTIAAQHAERHDRDVTAPVEAIEAIWSEGLGGLALPESLGGLGADLETVVAVVRTISEGDPSVGLIFSMTLIQELLLAEEKFPAALRQEVLAELHEGPALLNSLRGERDLGTPLYGGLPATTARWVDDGDEPYWKLNGAKAWATGIGSLRWLAVWARTADDPAGERVGSFFVRSDTPGIEIKPLWRSLGMRATVSHDVVFHDVRVPASRTEGLSPIGAANVTPWPAAVGGRITLFFLAIYQGAAHAAFDWFTQFVQERAPTALGAPLATLPRFQEAVGESLAHLHVADTLIADLDRRIGSSDDIEADDATAIAWLIKTEINENLIRAAEIPIAILGNPGLAGENPLQRHYRNLLSSRAHGPDRVQALIGLGRRALPSLTPSPTKGSNSDD